MFIFIYNRSFDIPNVSDYIFKRTAYLVNPPPHNRVARPIHNGTRDALI